MNGLSASMTFDDILPERIVLLVVDDDPAVLEVTRLILGRYQYQGRPVEILEALSAAEARTILQQRDDIAVLLLDVVMESDDAGLRLVEYIRTDLNNFRLRILLRTGQPGYAPERQVVQDYDINDYLMKADASQSRMIIAVTTAVRGYFDILRAEAMALKAQVSQQASMAKTQFLAHMSHEIRTPLNGVVGLVALLSDTSLSDEQKALIQDLRHASDALMGVVNDVLDVSKIEAGKLELYSESFRISNLIERVAAVFMAPLKARHIQFDVDAAEVPDLWMRGDGQRIQQILINYLSNAQKFTPDGGRIVFRVQCRQQDSGSWSLFAEVEDSGIGIRPGRLASIFEAYEQESAETSARYGGTGLGLSLSRSLAELMGGKVGADSQQGRGSRFWLMVPLKEDEACSEIPEAQTMDNVTVLAGVHILLAEDDQTSQKVLCRTLQNHGASIECFFDGQALLDSDGFMAADAILLDYHMPRLDGPATARALRGAGYDGFILALTGAVTEDDREQCLMAGMNDVVTKPIDRHKLVALIAAYDKKD
ncbi:response regulator [Thalassolituus marinus]|uniref:histidine kinase n=1 Tax=Thalassolituus marinus TaxID=671053 RepID=A0ABS7ZLI9_9GAMM|nr:response regulator [Thalassolituus marinus]MCA6062591.1 response regulator [Thalassolituus marinus]